MRKIALIILFVMVIINLGIGNTGWEEGVKLYKERRYTEAIKEFKDVIKYNPNIPNGYFMLGLCNYNIGNGKEAIDNFKKVLDLDNNHKGALFYIGKIYYDLSNCYEAVKYFSSALSGNSDSVTVLSILKLRASCYLKMKAYDSAINDLKILNDSNQNDAATFYLLGLAYYNKGEIKLAEGALRKALELEPSNRDYIVIMMNILIDLKKYEEAVKYGQIILAKNNNDQDLIELLADAYLGKKNYYQAIVLYKSLGNPSDRCLINIAQAYSFLGEYKQAESILEALVKKGSRNDKIYDLLAYVYEKMSELEKALSTYKKVYQMTKKEKYRDSIKRVEEKIKQKELEQSLVQ